MNIKSVVKVMNFHALLRVDKSRRQADRYNAMSAELEAKMRIILNNRNLKLDKSIRVPDPSKPVLRIYLGSDYGFCGSVNSSISSRIRKDSDAQKIIVGKKLPEHGEIALHINQEDFNNRYTEIHDYLDRAVRNREWSAVELVYNHYYNIASIKLVERRIYPLRQEDSNQITQAKMTHEELHDDFLIEGDATTLLEDMIVSYLMHAVKIASVSAFASENVMRQNTTQESLKKLDEIEELELREERKQRTQEAINKSIDSFTKQKALKK